MPTNEQKQQFTGILGHIGDALDITRPQFDAIVASYEAVGKQLTKEGSLLLPYKPRILPQGSFLLGTMNRPVIETDDLDIDLVCQLSGKQAGWTQRDVKQIVGNQLKDNQTYRDMLTRVPEGRRCWTLQYSETANYHMDILPAIVENGFTTYFEKSMAAANTSEMEGLAIRITDRREHNYMTETNILYWLRSNPFGYARWFYERAHQSMLKAFSMREMVDPVPAYRTGKDKLVLQRVIQLLKRHRDITFDGDEHKPISIIITTLAAHAYSGEADLTDALINVIQKMPLFIKKRYSDRHGRELTWIANPINDQENFADKWVETPAKEENFRKWLEDLRNGLRETQAVSGLNNLSDKMKKLFGDSVVNAAFSGIGAASHSTQLYVEPTTGNISQSGIPVKNHSFHGN